MAKAVKPAAKKSAPKKAPVKKVAAKKTAVKKSATRKTPVKKAASKSETGIKYEDKSAGQPELVPIFNKLKQLLLPYAKGDIVVRGGEGGQIVLVSEKPVEIAGKQRDEYWFAAVLVQRGYTGFYFMPVRTPAEVKEVFKPELLKCLKGKSCFHIRKYDEQIFEQVEEALAKGYRKCREKGWV